MKLEMANNIKFLICMEALFLNGIIQADLPSPILKIYVPFDSSSLADNISAKIFLRSRLVRALGRLKFFQNFQKT